MTKLNNLSNLSYFTWLIIVLLQLHYLLAKSKYDIV